MYLVISVLIFSYSCSNKNSTKSTHHIDNSIIGNINNDTLKEKSQSCDNSNLLSISGDWDGDKVEEMLFEYYFSRKLNKQVVPPCLSLEIDDIEDMISQAIELDVMSFLVPKDNKVDTLFISIKPNAQIWGIQYLKNEGDMDGDGADELGYVKNLAQMSTLTMYHIVSYKNGKWINLFSFPTWNWAELDKLVKKVGKNQYQVTYRGREAFEESIIIDFNKTPLPESLPFFVEGTMD